MCALLKCYVKVTIKSILQIYLMCNYFNEMINMRKNYEAPLVKVVNVEVEQGFAFSNKYGDYIQNGIGLDSFEDPDPDKTEGDGWLF